jgi:drug/metabolite transporter (DMT)-like permease
MLAVSLALIACLNWGISGFLAGMKSRIMPVLTLLVFSSMASVAMFIIIMGARGVPFPRDPRLLYAVMGGACGVGALYCLYRGLAVGAISVVVPVSSLCALVPVLTGLAIGEVLHPIQVFGILFAIGGGLMVSLEKNIDANKKRFASGILPALGAALGFGVFFVVMDLAGTVDPIWAAMISRASFFLFLLPAVLLKRPCLKVKTTHLPAVFAIGILDGSAALAYTTATTKGLLSLVAVISSLYPAVSVILAAFILKERLRGLQFFGVALAIMGVTLISAA